MGQAAGEVVSGVACPKPEARETTKARKDRAEAAIKKAVRAACVERDGYCRFMAPIDDKFDITTALSVCDGPSEWAHWGEFTRAKTRGMAASDRHRVDGSLMLCKRHHDHLDGRRLPRLIITALTDIGTNGPLRFAFRQKGSK